MSMMPDGNRVAEIANDRTTLAWEVFAETRRDEATDRVVSRWLQKTPTACRALFEETGTTREEEQDLDTALSRFAVKTLGIYYLNAVKRCTREYIANNCESEIDDELENMWEARHED